MTSSSEPKLDQPIHHTLQMIGVVLQPEKQFPPKLSEAVSELQQLAQAKNHADGGIAAVFSGIKQGKSLLKAAKDKSTEGDKDSAKISKVAEHMDAVALAVEKIPASSTEVDFDWDTRLKVGMDALDACMSLGKDNSNSKSIMTETKKKLGDFFGTLCRAYILGPVKLWLATSVKSHREQKSFANVQAVKSDETRKMETCLYIPKDVSQLCGIVADLQELIPKMQTVTCKSAAAEDKQSAVDVVKVVDAFFKFGQSKWAQLSLMGLTDSEMKTNFGAIGFIAKSLLDELVSSDTASVSLSIGDSIAKARHTVCLSFIV